MEVSPFSSFLDLNGYFKTEAMAKYGEPPNGHVELSSLSDFTKKMNNMKLVLESKDGEKTVKTSSPAY